MEYLDFLVSSDGKEPACNAGDPDLIPGSGIFPGVENGYPLQYSCLKNFIGRPWNHKESDTTKQVTLSLS